MRRLVIEMVLVAVVSIVIVSAALAGLPGHPDGEFLSRATSYIVTAATLDFGESLMEHAPVTQAVRAAALRTGAIIGGASLLLLAIGLPLGMLSATRSDSRIVRVSRAAIDVISSLPVLVWSTLIFVVFARTFGIIFREDVSVVQAVSVAIIALVLGDHVLADIVQRVELSTREIAAEPYMRTVRAAGFGYRRHLLQSLVRPVATAIAARSMFLIGGAIVAEQLFEIHGLGFTVVKALNQSEQEPNLILAASLGLVLIGLMFRIGHSLALVLADSRLRTSQ